MFHTGDGGERSGGGDQRCPTADELRPLVCRAASRVSSATVSPEAAVGLLADWTVIEHAAGAAKAMLGARAAAGTAWRDAGPRDAAEWMARHTGTTAARARDELATGRRLGELPATAASACRGELSPVQTAAIADAAAADPGAEAGLLGAAGRESVGELRERCARAKAAADADPESTRRRIHAARRLRRYATAEGMHHLHASGPAAALAAIDAALAPWIDDRFRTARAAGGERETFEARAFDALVDLASAAAPPPRPAPTPGGPSRGAAPAAPAEAPDGATPATPEGTPPAAPAEAPDGAAPATPEGTTAAAPGETSDGAACGAPAAPGAALAPCGRPPEGPAPDEPPDATVTAPGGDPAAASRPAPPARRRTPDRYKIVVRADLDALVRGTVAGDETCEIAGVGPVAVTAIRDLLGQATLHLVLTKGSAVANVTHLGRGPAAAQRIALLWQAPTCTRLGCPRRAHPRSTTAPRGPTATSPNWPTSTRSAAPTTPSRPAEAGPSSPAPVAAPWSHPITPITPAVGRHDACDAWVTSRCPAPSRRSAAISWSAVWGRVRKGEAVPPGTSMRFRRPRGRTSTAALPRCGSCSSPCRPPVRRRSTCAPCAARR